MQTLSVNGPLAFMVNWKKVWVKEIITALYENINVPAYLILIKKAHVLLLPLIVNVISFCLLWSVQIFSCTCNLYQMLKSYIVAVHNFNCSLWTKCIEDVPVFLVLPKWNKLYEFSDILQVIFGDIFCTTARPFLRQHVWFVMENSCHVVIHNTSTQVLYWCNILSV